MIRSRILAVAAVSLFFSLSNSAFAIEFGGEDTLLSPKFQLSTSSFSILAASLIGMQIIPNIHENIFNQGIPSFKFDRRSLRYGLQFPNGLA